MFMQFYLKFNNTKIHLYIILYLYHLSLQKYPQLENFYKILSIIFTKSIHILS